MVGHCARSLARFRVQFSELAGVTNNEEERLGGGEIICRKMHCVQWSVTVSVRVREQPTPRGHSIIGSAGIFFCILVEGPYYEE